MNYNELIFRNAYLREKNIIFNLYQKARESSFCVWNDTYPTMENINFDIQNDNLYVLLINNEIIGAISIEVESEIEDFNFWECIDGTQKEIARVVVSNDYQGNGLAKILMKNIYNVLLSRGCNGIHLAVAKDNIPAVKTYTKLGFINKGEANIFNGHYYLMEKILK